MVQTQFSPKQHPGRHPDETQLCEWGLTGLRMTSMVTLQGKHDTSFSLLLVYPAVLNYLEFFRL